MPSPISSPIRNTNPKPVNKKITSRSKLMEKRRDEQGCETPKREANRVPLQCPAAPRKKLPVLSKKKRDPPKNGYFQPPSDLEALFVRAPRREACA